MDSMDMKKMAKMGALSGLKKEMMKLLGEDVKGVKKVTVAAPDKESLKAGLDKAEEMLGGEESESEHEMPSGETMKDSEMSEGVDMLADEDMQELPESVEECDKMIQMLEQKKAKLAK